MPGKKKPEKGKLEDLIEWSETLNLDNYDTSIGRDWAFDFREIITGFFYNELFRNVWERYKEKIDVNWAYTRYDKRRQWVEACPFNWTKYNPDLFDYKAVLVTPKELKAINEELTGNPALKDTRNSPDGKDLGEGYPGILVWFVDNVKADKKEFENLYHGEGKGYSNELMNAFFKGQMLRHEGLLVYDTKEKCLRPAIFDFRQSTGIISDKVTSIPLLYAVPKIGPGNIEQIDPVRDALEKYAKAREERAKAIDRRRAGSEQVIDQNIGQAVESTGQAVEHINRDFKEAELEATVDKTADAMHSLEKDLGAEEGRYLTEEDLAKVKLSEQTIESLTEVRDNINGVVEEYLRTYNDQPLDIAYVVNMAIKAGSELYRKYPNLRDKKEIIEISTLTMLYSLEAAKRAGITDETILKDIACAAYLGNLSLVPNIRIREEQKVKRHPLYSAFILSKTGQFTEETINLVKLMHTNARGEDVYITNGDIIRLSHDRKELPEGQYRQAHQILYGIENIVNQTRGWAFEIFGVRNPPLKPYEAINSLAVQAKYGRIDASALRTICEATNLFPEGTEIEVQVKSDRTGFIHIMTSEHKEGTVPRLGFAGTALRGIIKNKKYLEIALPGNRKILFDLYPRDKYDHLSYERPVIINLPETIRYRA